MVTRWMFLAVVCAGSVAFGQAVATPNSPAQTAAAPAKQDLKVSVQSVVTPAKQDTLPLNKQDTIPAAKGALLVPAQSAATPAKNNTTVQLAPVTPAKKKPVECAIPTLPVVTPVTCVPVTPAEPQSVDMKVHFHMGGNFDACFEMNVTQGQAEQKQSAAKKH